MTVIAGSPLISTDSPPPVFMSDTQAQLHALTTSTEQAAAQSDQAARDVLAVLGHLGDANAALVVLAHDWVHEQKRADKADAFACVLGTELGKARAEAGLLRRMADALRAQCGDQVAERRVLLARLDALRAENADLRERVAGQHATILRLNRFAAPARLRRPPRFRRFW